MSCSCYERCIVNGSSAVERFMGLPQPMYMDSCANYTQTWKDAASMCVEESMVKAAVEVITIFLN